MIEKFEKLEDTDKENEQGKKIKEFKEVAKATATHKHICFHDEEDPRPCKRVKIK